MQLERVKLEVYSSQYAYTIHISRSKFLKPLRSNIHES